MKDCAMTKADASQRGHSCWFSSVTTSVANSITARESTVSKRSSFGLKKEISIGSDIFSHAGQEKHEERIHLKLTEMIGKDACPLKPKEGHNALNFMKKLLNLLQIENVIISTNAKANTTLPITNLGTCSMSNFDMLTYLETEALQKIKLSNVSSGICAIQVLAPASGCSSIIGLSDTITIGKFEKYELKLRNMLVSSHGHVITIGTCDKPNEWYVYDNEFAGKGSPLRKFESFSFQSVMDLMFNFPHTYFNPKIGAIPLNPLFLEGKQSATTFMFDIRQTSQGWTDDSN